MGPQERPGGCLLDLGLVHPSPGCHGGQQPQGLLWGAASERVILPGHRSEALQTQGSEEVALNRGEFSATTWGTWWVFMEIYLVFTTQWKATGI